MIYFKKNIYIIFSISIFIFLFIILFTFLEMNNNNNKMKMLVGFSAKKNIYCDNIIINKANGWYFNLTDKVFIKNDQYVELNNNNCRVGE